MCLMKNEKDWEGIVIWSCSKSENIEVYVVRNKVFLRWGNSVVGVCI